MKKQLRLLSAAFCLICITQGAFAQSEFFRSGFAARSEGSPAFLMFISDDDLHRTSVKGFGSGLLDAFCARQSYDALNIGSEKVFLSLGLGYSVNKYRFANNILLSRDQNGNAVFSPDTNSARDYVNTFFGYGKTKLVYGTFSIPAYLNIKSEHLNLSLGAFYDIWLSGKFKSKYIEDGVKIKDKIPNKELIQYPINKGKIGFSFAVNSNKSNYGIAVTYLMTPFF